MNIDYITNSKRPREQIEKSTNNTTKIVLLNTHGINNNIPYLIHLATKYEIICLLETWALNTEQISNAIGSLNEFKI